MFISDIKLKQDEDINLVINNKFMLHITRADVGYVIDMGKLPFNDEEDIIDSATIWDDDLEDDVDSADEDIDDVDNTEDNYEEI